ncbi:MAG TPA: TetR/AcrR family transcriptional regulator [Ktedonobacteraceae bacterium]|jgi:AcrR family transcriptional regulator|nr:TetR/AcrR family transcriptional regulator [Ktedonobacteraceae bacterium]
MAQNEKRERLIEAACRLIYQQGVYRTTLADIAQAAEVPLGNVYYHFRTKESLISAVIATHKQQLQAKFARWEQDPDPRQRLQSLLRSSLSHEDQLAQYGCPDGTLCQELVKENTPLAHEAADLMNCYLSWVEQQFRLLGKDDEAEDLALSLISSLQGSYLLTNTMHSTALLERRLEHLNLWLEQVA